jgi:CelD/BcsL family acetyltransferase involved in cellulose biosynthesis
MNRPALNIVPELPPPTDPAGGHLRAEWIGAQRIDDALLAEWDDLTKDAAQANVFAEPWLAAAGIRHCSGSNTAELCVVRDPGNRLVGIAALSSRKRIGRAPLLCSGDWSHPNSFLLSASARAGAEAPCWAAMIEAASARHGGSRALLIDGLVEGSGMHGGLLAAAQRLKLPVAVEARTVRAMLATDLEADAYWDASVRAKKRKELRRQWARLGELGVLTVDHGDPTADASVWIDEFLALEASGWKGTNGSALASNADTNAFFNEAAREGWARGQVLLTALRLDGRAIAILITLVSGNAGFSFKTAFDEEFARFSPGVLLQRESLSLLTTRKLAFIDSCAAQDHPMIDSLWRERRTVLSVSFPLPGTANRLAWRATQSAMAVWRGAKGLRQRPAAAVTRDDDE